MLIRFGVENHLSIRDRQELSLVASTLKDREDGLIASPVAPKHRFLPVALIYGANASGKSNVVKGLEFMRSCVLPWRNPDRNPDRAGGGVAPQPFALDDEFGRGLSKFDIEFVQGDTHYQYGFACSDSAFEEEWLFEVRGERRVRLFERTRQEFVFGRELRGRNKLISAMTRANTLIVSVGSQTGHSQFENVVNFLNNIKIENFQLMVASRVNMRLGRIGVHPNSLKFLSNIETGIKNIRTKPLEDDLQDPGNFLPGLEPDPRSNIKFRVSLKRPEMQFGRADNRGNNRYFDLDAESSGTLRLAVLLQSVFSALDLGTQVVVDEIDASLHTRAAEAIIALFASPETNPKGAQLIATTHDTNLLNSEILRRDQVWFTEKSPLGATSLYPLSDFRWRKGDNVEKGYLDGRFGAVPYAGSAAELLKGL